MILSFNKDKTGEIYRKEIFFSNGIIVFFLGFLGAHRYYTGYIGTGIVQTLTRGGCGIWSLIDFIFISINKYKDSENILL